MSYAEIEQYSGNAHFDEGIGITQTLWKPPSPFGKELKNRDENIFIEGSTEKNGHDPEGNGITVDKYGIHTDFVRDVETLDDG